MIVLFLFKTAFRRLNSVSVFLWNILNWAQSIKLVIVSRDKDYVLEPVSFFGWNLI
jgi:hypothetical protein